MEKEDKVQQIIRLFYNQSYSPPIWALWSATWYLFDGMCSSALQTSVWEGRSEQQYMM